MAPTERERERERTIEALASLVPEAYWRGFVEERKSVCAKQSVVV